MRFGQCKINNPGAERLVHLQCRYKWLYPLINGNVFTEPQQTHTFRKGIKAMTEKTRKQIEGIRNAQFGTEIEMYNITRQKAAKTAATYFGTGRYKYTGDERGYCSWSAWDAQGREWLFQRDSSIVARKDSERCELVSPLLNHSDLEFLQELVRQLRHAGARSNPEHFCGVHIHIHEQGHTPQSLRNLVNLMASHEDLIAKAVKLDRNREARYCKMVDPGFLERLNSRKPTTMEALADCWYNGSPGRNSHYHPSRYSCLNYHSLFRGSGIELRLFQFDSPSDDKKGGLNAGQLKAMIQFSLGLSELAKSIKYASPKKGQRDNEKYGLRCFLLRMGLIGDEFKTAREYFLRNASGNSAFRHAA